MDIKILLAKLDKEIECMYEIFQTSDELSGALYHLGAMRSLVTLHMEHYDPGNDPDKDCVRSKSELGRTLEQETQTKTDLSDTNRIPSKSPYQHDFTPVSSDSDTNSSPEAGRRQFVSLLEIDPG